MFVDHKTKLVYPSFQETKTGEEACGSKFNSEIFSKRYNVDIDKPLKGCSLIKNHLF
jgi:hypothetical protein